MVLLDDQVFSFGKIKLVRIMIFPNWPISMTTVLTIGGTPENVSGNPGQ